MPPAISTVYLVEHVSVMSGQVGEMRSFWRVDATTGTGCSDAEIATGFSAGPWAAAIKALMSVAATYRGARIQNLSPPKSIALTDASAAGAGTVAGDAMSTQVCGLLSSRTALAGRKNRGRKYVPFPGEADNGPTGLPTAGYITRLNALAALYEATYVITGAGGTTSFDYVIYNPKLATVAGPVIVVSSSPNWATQRRRGSLGRPNPTPF